MKRGVKIVLIIIVLLSFVVGGYSLEYFHFNSGNKSFINISDLSQEFMDDYFKEISNIKDKDRENILIVISENKLKNTYGASKVIEAPNNQYILQYGSLEEKDYAFSKLQNDKSIYSVEENEVEYAEEDEFNSWGIQKMYLDNAINVANEKNLQKVTVAIIDTGLDVDLFNSFFEGKIESSYNVLNESENIEDMSDSVGHGTHIAGIIGEGTPDNVKILPIKVSETLSFDQVNLVAAINYATYNHYADVLNLSYGGTSVKQAQKQALEAAANEKIINVASAGNKNNSDVHYPSGYDSVIAISAVDSDLNKYVNSNFGSSIDFAAPGANIQSINISASGTSMAVPHAVSAVAILKGYNKNLVKDDVMELLKQTAIDIGNKGWDEYFGFGFISFKDVEFCDGVNCDQYGVYKLPIKEITSIELTDLVFTGYNYYSITNILGSRVNVIYEDGTKRNIKISELPDLKIYNYDSTISAKQTVTIRTGSVGVDIDLTNPVDYESGWLYNDLGNNKIEITGYKNHNMDISKLYFPESIDSKGVVSIADNFQFAEMNDFDAYKYLFLSESLNSIGSYNFSQTNLFEISLGSNLDTIGESAFEGCDSLSSIIIPESVSSIDDNAFKDCLSLENVYLLGDDINLGENIFEMIPFNEDFVIYVHKDTIVEEYAVLNNIRYRHIEPDDVIVINEKTKYQAKEVVDVNNISVKLIYHDDGDREELLSQLNPNIHSIISDGVGYSIIYQNGSSFQFGDTYYTIIAKNQLGYETTKNIMVEVEKIPSEYTIPNNLTAKVGQQLSEIELPSGFEWMDGNQIIDVVGNVTFKARYIPSDINNYEIVENIDLSVLVSDDENVSPCVINDYLVDSSNLFINRISINTGIDYFTSKFSLDNGYELNVDSKEVNGEQILYTGGKTRIMHGLEVYKVYTNSVLGDVTGSGTISNDDVLAVYELLRQRLTSNEPLDDTIYSNAADVVKDGDIKINDLVKLYYYTRNKIDSLS